MKFIVLMFLFTYALVATAQKGIGFGPRTGMSLNNVGSSPYQGNLYKAHFNGAFFVNYHFNSNFGLKTELGFNSYSHDYNYITTESYFKKLQGVLKFFGTGVDTATFNSIINGAGGAVSDSIYNKYKGQTTIKYIELPVMGIINYKGIQVAAGISVGFSMKSSAKQIYVQEVPLLDVLKPSLDTIPLLGTLFRAIVPQYKNPKAEDLTNIKTVPVFNFGLISEINYQFENNISIGIRLNYALQKYKPAEAEVKEVRNVGFVFSLGYTFGTVLSSKPKAIYDLEKIPVSNPQ